MKSAKQTKLSATINGEFQLVDSRLWLLICWCTVGVHESFYKACTATICGTRQTEWWKVSFYFGKFIQAHYKPKFISTLRN